MALGHYLFQSTQRKAVYARLHLHVGVQRRRVFAQMPSMVRGRWAYACPPVAMWAYASAAIHILHR